MVDWQLDFDVLIFNGTRLRLEQSLSECVLAVEILDPKLNYINGGFYSCIKNSKFMYITMTLTINLATG